MKFKHPAHRQHFTVGNTLFGDIYKVYMEQRLFGLLVYGTKNWQLMQAIEDNSDISQDSWMFPRWNLYCQPLKNITSIKTVVLLKVVW